MFFWESLWKLILTVDIALVEVMKGCAFFSIKFGLNHPSEKTGQHVVTTVCTARMEVTKSDISAADRLV